MKSATDQTTPPPNNLHSITYRSYFIGLILSIFFTLTAYFLVTERFFSVELLVGMIVCLCIVQIWVQLLFFLHVGSESKPWWNVQALVFMLLVVGIVLGGTMWIMYNLNYRMMPSMEQTRLPRDNEIINPDYLN